MNIGAAVRNNRLQRKLTYEAYSEKSGVSKETVGRLERKSDANVTLSTIELLAKGFGMSAWELIREAENE